MSGLLRSFVAIGLPDPVADELAAVQDHFAVGRSVAWENLHLTLAFLGDQSPEALGRANEALAALRAAPFALRLAGLEPFGGRVPRAIVARTSAAPALAALEDRVTRALRQAGLSFPRQRFRPHVTLLRLPRSLTRGELTRLRDALDLTAGFRGRPFTVTGFGLWQSVLGPEGPVYRELAGYDLTGD